MHCPTQSPLALTLKQERYLSYFKFYTAEYYLILFWFLSLAFLKDEIFTSSAKIYSFIIINYIVH